MDPHINVNYVYIRVMCVFCALLGGEQLVDVAGITKGKGFQGVMKKWNFGCVSHACLLHNAHSMTYIRTYVYAMAAAGGRPTARLSRTAFPEPPGRDRTPAGELVAVVALVSYAQF
jgi:hypothetical protein